MTRTEQKKFVKELVDAVAKKLLEKLPHIPEEWDGHELRQWIVDYFQAEITGVSRWGITLSPTHERISKTLQTTCVPLEAGFHYRFGELKAGDRFVWEGTEYEKISGNTAVRLYDDKCVEIPDDIPGAVYLYELG